MLRSILFVLFIAPSLSLAGLRSTKVEIHHAVCEKDVATILRKLNLTTDQFYTRKVFYFDNNQLDLYRQGIILRARVKKKGGEVTAKLRPFEDHQIVYPWGKRVDCETDHYGNSFRPSCSYDQHLDPQSMRSFIFERKYRKLFGKQTYEYLLD